MPAGPARPGYVRGGPRPLRRRQSKAVYRRRRLLVATCCLALAGLATGLATSGGGGGAAHRTQRHQAALAAGERARAPAIEAGLLPWTLPAPLSRAIALATPSRQLVVAGGLEASGASTAAVERLDPATGQASPLPSLASPVHDAGGALIDGSAVVMGGGSTSTVATVQAAPLSGRLPGGQVLGELPEPRSDSAAVTARGVTYLVGGYNGSSPDLEVLSTRTGRSWQAVAKLAVGVRYAAVAALGGDLYVMGGEEVGGALKALTAIQRVDLRRHRTTVIGHLPFPLEGAAAFTLDGHVYLAGGESPDPPVVAPGVGTTQLDGWGVTPGGAASPGLGPVGSILELDPASGRVLVAGRLQVPVAHAALAVASGRAWLLGGSAGGRVFSSVQVLQPNPSFGLAGKPGAGSPYYGYQLLVADRGNNRLLLMNPSMQVTWSYPGPGEPPDPLGFYFPDDAFFVHHGTAIISNQEENETIVEIAYPSGRVIWSYGHPKVPGAAPGYLHEPDDAYLLKDGQVTVADADNCRVLVINRNGTVASQIGTTGVCYHNPPASMGSPNGDTPLWDGNLLVSEINGSWVSEYTPSGHLVWTVHLPISYPSDPQQLGAGPGRNTDRYLIADYASPGEVLQFTREGRILSTYDVASGPGRLDHPSLAEEMPDGIYMINDDYNDRMVAIDPADGALVWQYGVTGEPGTSAGMLSRPDGFDLLGPGGATPTHPQTG